MGDIQCGDERNFSAYSRSTGCRYFDSAKASQNIWQPFRILSSLVKHNCPTLTRWAHCFAETKGFEPSRAFRPYLVSSEALSATQPPLQ